jgi:hypothetical protein
MEEPHLQSISFRRNLHQELPFFPCTDWRRECRRRISAFSARQKSRMWPMREETGAAARSSQGWERRTIYPEYRQRLKELMK